MRAESLWGHPHYHHQKKPSLPQGMSPPQAGQEQRLAGFLEQRGQQERADRLQREFELLRQAPPLPSPSHVGLAI